MKLATCQKEFDRSRLILRRRLLAWLSGILGLAAGAAAAPAIAQEILEADAFLGGPLGVGRVEITLDPRAVSVGSNLSERSGRLLYPTQSVSTRPVRRLLRELVGAPARAEVFFLFSGNEPLELEVAGARGAVRLRPIDNEDSYERLLMEWWSRYASLENRDDQPASYPTLVEDYLIGNLARRMRLPVPRAFIEQPEQGDLTHAIRVLGGAESVHASWVRRVALGRLPVSEATEPLPKPLAFTLPQSQVAGQVKVEAIAERVPPELLYVRFGSFPNYLWFSHRLDEWSGEVRSLVSERSIDYGLSKRQQELLCLEESALAEFLGPAVISDVALVGADMFQREGAAIGILFEARNSALLTNDINADRAAALESHPTAKEEQIEIGGRKASFIHTPDNRLRSIYVIIDNYHLVTASRAIAERFVEVAKTKKSLGATAEFRNARELFPVNRNDTVFIYLSTEFLQKLVSPHYQVELGRRLRSLAEMDVLRAARVEAKAQGIEAYSIEELVAAGMLPKDFGVRPDGSKLVDRDGVLIDTRRGPRGMFVPVPDMSIDKVTPREAEECLQVARNYAASWEQMTPIIAAIGRSKGAKEGLERVSLDFRLTPLAAKQYDFLASQLGMPTQQRLAPIPGDAVAFDLVLSQALGSSGGDYHLFGGLRDLDPRMMSGTMVEKLLGMFGGKELVGYLGAYPRPGVLWFLGASANLPVDEAGYSQFLTGSWRRLVGDFTLLSFQASLLEEITPQLKFIRAERPAQGWLRATDLRESRLAPALNAFGYRKATERTLGNIRFLNSLTEQFDVPAEDALKTAEYLLAAKLVCPLGGTYELDDPRSPRPRWTSTALPSGRGSPVPPEDYEFPALYWLRGIEAELRLTQEELALHADIQMPVQTRALPSFELPNFGFPLLTPKQPKKAEEIPAPKEPAKPQAREREF